MIDRECRKCGCTDLSACIDDGEPCCWVDDALCSVCHDRLADMLPKELAAVLAEIVDANLFVSPGAPLGHPATLRLAHFMPDLAERAAALLEEAEQL